MQVSVTGGKAMVRAMLGKRLFGDPSTAEALGSLPPAPLEVAVADADQRIVGGLVGSTHAGVLEIHVVWVAPSHRAKGLGRRILQAAEQEARRRGCVCAVVSSYTVQAPGFYEEFGYRSFGEVRYANLCRVYLRKDLAPTEGHSQGEGVTV